MKKKKLYPENATLKPLVENLPIMGKVRDPSLPPVGVQPGMTLAKSSGVKDPEGYESATDTYTPGFVREAKPLVSETELDYQRDSALAHRQPTPEASAATMADLTSKRLLASSNERLQAMKSASDVEASQARAEGNVRMAALNATGKEDAARQKELDTLSGSIWTWQNIITGGDSSTPLTDKTAIDGYKALIARARKRSEELMGVEEPGGGGQEQPKLPESQVFTHPSGRKYKRNPDGSVEWL